MICEGLCLELQQPVGVRVVCKFVVYGYNGLAGTSQNTRTP